MSERLYTTNEAAALLGVDASRVRQLILDNAIETVKAGRDHLMTLDAIKGAKRRKTKPGPVAKAPATKGKRKRAVKR